MPTLADLGLLALGLRERARTDADAFSHVQVSDAMAASKDDIVPVTKLIDNFDAGYDYITNNGTLFYFQTNKDAPRYKDETLFQ